MEDKKLYELNDDELENISGGYAVGDVVRVRHYNIEYCSNCARLLMNYDATITGVRGVLNGHTVYWVTRHCCGIKSSIIDYTIV